MKILSFSFYIGRQLCSGLAIVFHPVFLLPFIAGLSYSYLYSERYPTIRAVEAETRIIMQDSASRSDKAALNSATQQQAKPKKKELPKSGVLAQTRSSGTGASSVDVPWGSDVMKDKAPPITGSVSRLGARDWSLKVFNNTDDVYSASLEVLQFAKGGKRLKSDNYSYTLKPKERVERKFIANQGVVDCALNLSKWKNLSSSKRAVVQVTPTVATPVVIPTLHVDGSEVQVGQ